MVESELSSSKLAIAYILLAHESAEQIGGLVHTLLGADPTAHVVVHYDLNSPPAQFAALEQTWGAHERASLVKDRVRCGWGRFGLVDGVVRALRVLRDHNVECDYVYLISGSCMPTKPLATLKRFLVENRGMEFIEAHPAEWMVDGLREERYQYRHWFSHRTHRALFESSWRIQRFLGLKRRLPKRLVAQFGSQWWCLTSGTCFAILDFIDRNPGAYRFFKTTWIPDELFFQTLASSIATPARVFGNNLTFFKFTWKGRPITFYDDHLELVPQLPCFFARKISPTAHALRQRLAEIAAAPDDGEAFPSLEAKSEVFDYDKRVYANVGHPMPGQLYYGGQSFSAWPSSLANVRRPFVVLHGPPAVTRIVAEHIRQFPGLTLLGRVFSPKEVQLEPLGEAYVGFGPDDALIRDMDPPLYLSRLLERADGLPVIEICPGDIPHGEGNFLYNNNVVFVSCQPNDPTDEANRRLYWTLVANANPESQNDALLEWSEGSNLRDIWQYADALIEKYTHPEHRKWLTEALLGQWQQQPFVRLHWGHGKRRAAGESAARLADFQDMIGPAIRPLIRALSGIDARLGTIRPIEITGDLPVEWQAYFSSGAGRTAENWVAAFDHSSTGYAVLYGPPALTRVVSEHLKGVPEAAVLGRVFEPRESLAAASAEGGSEIAQTLMLRDRDRPLYLRQLLTQAEGFPVIEVCPGDEPVGEGFMISHENAVVISCQPNLLDDDANRMLYWALAGTASAAGAGDGEPPMPGGRLRARESIESSIENSTPREHREWVNRTILDDGWFQMLPESEEFIRLFWGAPPAKDQAVSQAEDLTARLLRILGQAGRPLVNALSDLQTRLATQRLGDVTAPLPEPWRAYFSLLKPDTVPAVEWAAELQRSSISYAVLYGPPSMTRVVREHLAQSPDLALLGRVFDPGSHDAEDRRLFAEDRPGFLTRRLERAAGFPIVEICPGDEPLGEIHMLRDENALFISCQPDHSDPEDRARLFWALSAAADPASAEKIASGDRARLSLLRVRNEIDRFIGGFTFSDHHKTVTDALLGDGASAQVLRLVSGAGGRAAARPLAATLARLRRALGPAFTPVLKALNGVEAKLRAIRTSDLAVDLPAEWRDYFTTGEEPTFETWEAALGSSTATYGVLFGPPAATNAVRNHLAGLPGVTMLGRVFGPDAGDHAAASPQASNASRSRAEDRPAAFANALAASEGFPIIEICPGDERHGEEFFLSDPNALILSCEPADPRDPDQTMLYWALVATGSRAAQRELASAPVAGDGGSETRILLQDFVARRVLPAHQEWFGQAVLFPERDDRIVRLRWAGAASANRQDDEPLTARLARLSHLMGNGIAPLVEALSGVEKAVAPRSLEMLVAGLPFEWRQIFVTRFEAEEKVA